MAEEAETPEERRIRLAQERRERDVQRAAARGGMGRPGPVQVPFFTPAHQSAILLDAAKRTEDAIGEEMKSRVTQAREVRRMQHEKDIERMRLDAILARLRAAQEEQRPPVSNSQSGPLRVNFPGGGIVMG